MLSNGRKEQRYLLHRLILSQCSGFFEASTSEEWSQQQAQTAGPSTAQMARIPGSAQADNRKRWRYELDWGNKEEDLPMLVKKDATTSSATLFGGENAAQPPPARNKPPASQAGFFRSMANFSALNVPATSGQADPDDEIFKDYDNLFRACYNYEPNLDTVHIPNAYVECKSLLQLADMYDALEIVGPRVDHHLLRFRGQLFKQIAKYPPSYLKLGYLARSRVIFSEALVHVVGQWPAGANQLRGQTPESVMDLIEDKYEELEEVKARVEGKLFRLTLTTSRGERVTPSNNWLDWLAMSLFRQWLAENTTPQPVPILKDTSSRNTSSRGSTAGHARIGSGQPNGALPMPTSVNTGRVFRILGTGGTAYLTHDELKRFLKLQPEQYNRENMKRFERRMEELKNIAKDTVKPLMRNFLELDMSAQGAGGGGLPYLTCTRIDEQDFPWEQP